MSKASLPADSTASPKTKNEIFVMVKQERNKIAQLHDGSYVLKTTVPQSLQSELVALGDMAQRLAPMSEGELTAAELVKLETKVIETGKQIDQKLQNAAEQKKNELIEAAKLATARVAVDAKRTELNAILQKAKVEGLDSTDPVRTVFGDESRRKLHIALGFDARNPEKPEPVQNATALVKAVGVYTETAKFIKTEIDEKRHYSNNLPGILDVKTAYESLKQAICANPISQNKLKECQKNLSDALAAAKTKVANATKTYKAADTLLNAMVVLNQDEDKEVDDHGKYKLKEPKFSDAVLKLQSAMRTARLANTSQAADDSIVALSKLVEQYKSLPAEEDKSPANLEYVRAAQENVEVKLDKYKSLDESANEWHQKNAIVAGNTQSESSVVLQRQTEALPTASAIPTSREIPGAARVPPDTLASAASDSQRAEHIGAAQQSLVQATLAKSPDPAVEPTQSATKVAAMLQGSFGTSDVPAPAKETVVVAPTVRPPNTLPTTQDEKKSVSSLPKSTSDEQTQLQPAAAVVASRTPPPTSSPGLVKRAVLGVRAFLTNVFPSPGSPAARHSLYNAEGDESRSTHILGGPPVRQAQSQLSQPIELTGGGHGADSKLKESVATPSNIPYSPVVAQGSGAFPATDTDSARQQPVTQLPNIRPLPSAQPPHQGAALSAPEQKTKAIDRFQAAHDRYLAHLEVLKSQPEKEVACKQAYENSPAAKLVSQKEKTFQPTAQQLNEAAEALEKFLETQEAAPVASVVVRPPRAGSQPSMFRAPLVAVAATDGPDSIGGLSLGSSIAADPRTTRDEAKRVFEELFGRIHNTYNQKKDQGFLKKNLTPTGFSAIEAARDVCTRIATEEKKRPVKPTDAEVVKSDTAALNTASEILKDFIKYKEQMLQASAPKPVGVVHQAPPPLSSAASKVPGAHDDMSRSNAADTSLKPRGMPIPHSPGSLDGAAVAQPSNNEVKNAFEKAKSQYKIAVDNLKSLFAACGPDSTNDLVKAYNKIDVIKKSADSILTILDEQVLNTPLNLQKLREATSVLDAFVFEQEKLLAKQQQPLSAVASVASSAEPYAAAAAYDDDGHDPDHSRDSAVAKAIIEHNRQLMLSNVKSASPSKALCTEFTVQDKSIIETEKGHISYTAQVKFGTDPKFVRVEFRQETKEGKTVSTLLAAENPHITKNSKAAYQMLANTLFAKYKAENPRAAGSAQYSINTKLPEGVKQEMVVECLHNAGFDSVKYEEKVSFKPAAKSAVPAASSSAASLAGSPGVFVVARADGPPKGQEKPSSAATPLGGPTGRK